MPVSTRNQIYEMASPFASNSRTSFGSATLFGSTTGFGAERSPSRQVQYERLVFDGIRSNILQPSSEETHSKSFMRSVAGYVLPISEECQLTR